MMTLPHFDIETVAAADIPALLIQLAGLQTALAARLLAMPAPAATPTPAADRMLTVKEVAERLRCSVKSVYRRVDTFPFARRNGGRAWIFSEQGLTKWLARQRM
jgi:predicted DNA-binding transcriptional regulator AlpA